jgi:hypothetical protein
MTGFVAPPVRIPADAVFYRCRCGAPIWEHGRGSNQVWGGCSTTDCEKYRASDGSSWPNNHAGATLDAPTDLDVNTDHWIDRRVYLSTDEPPQ